MKWPDDFLNKVVCGDCLEVMKYMPNDSIDLLWTDPPYNCGKDYGVYKDKMSDEEYRRWVSELFFEFNRVAKRVCILTPHKYAVHYWSTLGEKYKQIIIPFSPEGAIRYGFSNQYSFLLTNAQPNQRCKNVWNNVQMPGLGYFFKEDKMEHPGYTSEDLTSRVLNYFSLTGDVVFDPFNGTGTTTKMAKKGNRKYIGIEINPDYCKIAEQRLAQDMLL